MRKIAVFASGSGTNFQAIADAAKNGEIDASVELMVCDREGAKVIKRAAKENIPAFVFNPKAYPDKQAYEQEILVLLQKKEIEWIVLAGYMRLIGSVILDAYPQKIVNIHPSLLPAFPGKDAIGQAFAAGVKVTGVTVHYVDEGMDTGPIIAQAAVPVLDGDTPETLAARIHETEHVLYPNVLKKLFAQQTSMEVLLE
ncbi:phosphoribosylglycinamide formyltransferase [Weizmannia acidilactici]|jgi:phosphoribosylglycinamide formyltransferase-1|uniref:Phosphoribosylglycinamide formyltransferase n=1 Tax=Weizmannia acidilactici TaxID=2607726 RepID=A0A5J4J701_9BACI|nr:phosphoribosylglycinamide formyltransferase [Weizmannia acidilactici]GER68015.1 phosphoribosylglycinamide formyltransferase [Weizmannia acidilactici]GER70706.1 phosphoribosylglycinamide formyltransferase [Weizmannia acidilactici]GER74199.1 phosphoribosylglycinamide formyltransferase [Weizmannia acidilactici]